jgi:exo-beta-1,3-glucanase (GH17 family)
MSNYYKRRLSLAGIDISTLSTDDLRALVRKILESKIHGLSFSPYIEGEGPGTIIKETQIRDRLAIIEPYVRWIRSFSCTEGHELIPAIAKEKGLKTMVGVWLDNDREHNELELGNAIRIANQGDADILAVGNEVLLRGDLTEDELLDYVRRVKKAAPDVDVGYVDAYFEFVDHPRITEACDVLLANCYPFWESVANGKRVIVSETGWPNIGSAEGAAAPSFENAIKYFVDTCRWAEAEDIEIFYFSSFDESWKVGAEGDVGAYWGLWDKDGRPKYHQ